MGEILNDWTYRQAKANLRKAEVEGEAAVLASSIAGYEALKVAGRMSLELDSLQDLGRALIKARVARGWSQKQLAQRLDMPKQQVQRYEATEYGSASLRRILEIADALDISFKANVECGSGSDRAAELARSLAGYSAAEAVQHVEKRTRLRAMTADESRRIFDNLCETYYQLSPLHRPAAVESPEDIGHRLAVRGALETLARKRGDDR